MITQLTEWSSKTVAFTGLSDGMVHQYQSDGSWLKIDSGLPGIRELVQRGDVSLGLTGTSLWRRANPSAAWQEVVFPNSSSIAVLRAQGDFFWAWTPGTRLPLMIPKIFRSADGISWTDFFVDSPPTPSPSKYNDLRWANGRYVLVGDAYQMRDGFFSHHGGLWTSANGIDWQRENEADGIYHGVAHRNGLWLAGGTYGNFATSQDGSTWTLRRHSFVSQYFTNGFNNATPMYSDLRNVVASAGGFHATVDVNGTEIVVVSDDGLEWTVGQDLPDAVKYRSFQLAASGGETWLWTQDGNVLKSEDWRWSAERVLPEEPSNWQVAMASPTEAVLLGEAGRVAYSVDGIDWIFSQVPGVAGDPAAGMWNAQRREYAAIASSAGNRAVQFWRSADGRNWGSRNLPIMDKAVGMAYGNGRYVVATQAGHLLHSNNGLNWQISGFTLIPLGAPPNELNELADIMFDGQKFIALGARGNLFESSNGEAWLQRAGPFSSAQSRQNKILFADGLYLCYGQAGNFLSDDGFSWNRLSAYGTGQIIYAFGEWLQVSEKRLVYSNDAIRWNEIPEPRPFGLNGNTLVIYQNRLIVGSDNGAIYQSQPWFNAMDSWRTTQFDAAALANPAISGDAADPDADGMSNLLEYAFGMNPRLTDTRGIFRNRFQLYAVSATETKKMFQFSFPSSVESQGVKVWIEQSSDLENWSQVMTDQQAQYDPNSIINGRRLMAVELEVKADGSTPKAWFRVAARRKE